MKIDGMELDKDEIQGLLFTGYPKNSGGAYLMLRVLDAAQARAWLRASLSAFTFGERRSYAETLNVAISAPGLAALGLDSGSLRTFPLEFREGLREADGGVRPRIL